MASLNYLNNQLEECNILIDKINNIRDELTKALNSLETATSIGNYYSIDNISADDNNIEIQRKNISSIITNLGSSISSVNNTITSLKKEIEKEKNRIKREEEKKKEENNDGEGGENKPVDNTRPPKNPFDRSMLN